MWIFKKYWLIVLLAFIATILVIINFFITNKNNGQKTPVQTAVPSVSWKGVVPGQTNKDQLVKLLGTPDPAYSNPTNNTYAYPREQGPPNLVFLDGDKVGLIKEMVTSGNLSQYIQKYGKPEGEYWGENQESGFKIYIFSKSGLAVMAHQKEGLVVEIWYFQPTTLENFLAIWGRDLSLEEKPQGY